MSSSQISPDILFSSTIYSFVTKSRKDKPDVLSMLWVCQYAPDLSAYVPMYVHSDKLSKAWISGSAFVSFLLFILLIIVEML